MSIVELFSSRKEILNYVAKGRYSTQKMKNLLYINSIVTKFFIYYLTQSQAGLYVLHPDTFELHIPLRQSHLNP